MTIKGLNRKRLRVLLAERGWTQLDLAKRMNLPPTTLNGYVCNRHPVPAEVMTQLANELGVDEDDLKANGGGHE